MHSINFIKVSFFLNTEIVNNVGVRSPTSAVCMRIIHQYLHLIYSFFPAGMSAEQQRAAVHKRLLLVAEEIFMMLEEMNVFT